MVKNKNKEKETKRVIPKKNYILLCVLFCGGILLVWYICSWYETISEFKLETPIIRNHLPEITNQELEHYVDENPTSIVYFCTSSDEKCRRFEKSFIKLIEQEELYNEVTYVNLSNADNYQFIDFFNNTYGYRISINSNYPAFVAFNDGKVVDILQEKENITISDLKKFLDKNKIDGDTYE